MHFPRQGDILATQLPENLSLPWPDQDVPLQLVNWCCDSGLFGNPKADQVKPIKTAKEHVWEWYALPTLAARIGSSMIFLNEIKL